MKKILFLISILAILSLSACNPGKGYYKACNSNDFIEIESQEKLPTYVKYQDSCYKRALKNILAVKTTDWEESDECAVSCSTNMPNLEKSDVMEKALEEVKTDKNTVSKVDRDFINSKIFCKLEIPYKIKWTEKMQEDIVAYHWFKEDKDKMYYKMSMVMESTGEDFTNKISIYNKNTDETISCNYIERLDSYTLSPPYKGGEIPEAGLRLPLMNPLFEDGTDTCPKSVQKNGYSSYPCYDLDHKHPGLPDYYKQLWGRGFYPPELLRSNPVIAQGLAPDYDIEKEFHGLKCVTDERSASPCVNTEYCINLAYNSQENMLGDFGVIEVSKSFSDSVFEFPSECS